MAWTTFLDLVIERPDSELKIDEYLCPYCNSTNVEATPQGQTLVADYGTDANHVWTGIQCNDCGKTCTHEHRSFNSWYTDSRGKILRGIPSCFERYIYTCRHCGGDVVRKYLKLDSDEEVSCCSYGPDENGIWTPKQRTVFECHSCGESVESNVESWHEGCEVEPKPRKTVGEKKLMKEWAIYEEVGIAVINPGTAVKVEGPPDLLEKLVEEAQLEIDREGLK